MCVRVRVCDRGSGVGAPLTTMSQVVRARARVRARSLSLEDVSQLFSGFSGNLLGLSSTARQQDIR